MPQPTPKSAPEAAFNGTPLRGATTVAAAFAATYTTGDQAPVCSTSSRRRPPPANSGSRTVSPTMNRTPPTVPQRKRLGAAHTVTGFCTRYRLTTVEAPTIALCSLVSRSLWPPRVPLLS